MNIHKQRGLSLIEMMIVLLLGSLIIGITGMLYTRASHAAKSAYQQLNAARKVAVGVQLFINELHKLEGLSPLNCPRPELQFHFSHVMASSWFGLADSQVQLVKIYHAEDQKLVELGINALAGTEVLAAYIPIASLNYLEFSAKAGETRLRLHHAENPSVQGALWLLANCQVNLLLAGYSYRSNLILDHTLDHDVVAGAMVWPLELHVFYIAKIATGQSVLFMRDDSGRHELVVGIDQLQFEYGWADSGALLWTDMVIGTGQLALVKIKLAADSVIEEGEVAI
ncbi:PilW family protein [Piscirickettsia salmonis]|uniref:PilW family protein n=1 Tax=Piscirickettsia salmonis TaxID=1238 RepID=UPI0007D813D5|nr:hypothetical protein A0O36_00483 [Piscirickettsiaceae bacterium NZ-RLO1]